MKILAPAGNFECLKVAVINGANEVYLGVNEFNARNNIDGFNMATIKDAIDYAHLFGVKVLLAVNILFSDDEIQGALDLVVDAYNMGIDAFIVQDLGLMSLIHSNYPEIELHASTQMGLHNLEGVKEVLKYGVKRVVLARETPLSEIKRIKQNVDVEIEYFVHGALCVSFSGNCYLSSYMLNASGNRGRCKQLCRLPYTLSEKGKTIKKGYLLSAKDFDMTSRLKDLNDAGVDVLKIEGRARRPFYVATTTKAYKMALEGEKVDYDGLKLAFNRNFTEGYFNGNGNIISEIQNHIGVKIGKVESVKNGKNFNEVFISSSRVLSPKSTFKMIYKGIENNTLTAFDLSEISNGKYRLTSTQKVNVGDSVHLITDAILEEETLKTMLKRPLEIELDIRENQPLRATITIFDKRIEVLGEVCQSALKQPLVENEVQDNFLKSQLFEARLNIKSLESVFVAKQKLNEFRRKVFETAFKEIVSVYERNLSKVNLVKPTVKNKFNNFEFFEYISDVPKAKNVIYSPETYSLENIVSVKDECEKQGKNFYLDTPYFVLEKDIKLLSEIIDKTQVRIVANNYYALSFNTQKVIGAGLNVYNSFTAKEYNYPIFTAESELCEKTSAPYMILRHCPIKSHFGGNCDNCRFYRDFTYTMDNGRVLKLKRKKLSDCTFYLTD